MNKKILISLCIAMGFVSSVIAQNAPQPVGLVPNERQCEWFDREMIAFFHFGINTFEDFVNEGDGRAPAAIFNPTELDCGQWMKILSDAGITAAIITAKHADGFCLWPSEYTDYCVKNSAWKNGKGDVVREFVDACDKYGIKAGIYLGPHDRHEFDARNLIDNDPATYYAGKDDDVTSTITFKLPKAETFDCLSISEVIELGHRTSRWSMEYSENGKDWSPIPGVTAKQSIGHKWIERVPPITARWVRLNIEDGRACPAIHSLGLYLTSSLLK